MTKPYRTHCAALIATSMIVASCDSEPAKVVHGKVPSFYDHVAEALPEDIEQRQIAFERSVADAAAAEALEGLADGFDTQASVIIKDYRRWAPGSIVTVAFQAAPSVSAPEQQLRAAIEQIAKEWVGQNGADLVLNFRNADGSFRQWSGSDTVHTSDIRLTFAGRGYWSAIGAFSKEPSVFRPNEPSMSLAGFIDRRPTNWRRVVRHEFGHALGFMHEHQNINVDCRFRYDDDQGYVPTRSARGAFIPDPSGRRPGLYTWFSGYPNFWSRAKVTGNLGPIGMTSIYTPDDFTHSRFDAVSIMKYFFEPEFFVDGQNSPCFTAEAQALSAQDRATASLAYRRDGLERRVESMEYLRDSAELPAEVRRRAAVEVRELQAAMN